MIQVLQTVESVIFREAYIQITKLQCSAVMEQQPKQSVCVLALSSSATVQRSYGAQPKPYICVLALGSSATVQHSYGAAAEAIYLCTSSRL